MKKLISLIVILIFLISVVSCSKKSITEIALITTAEGTIGDRSFIQSAWEGVEEYAKENKKKYKYYDPAQMTDAAYAESVELAVLDGAKIIIAPGYLFTDTVYKSQKKYPDVKFILIDAVPLNANGDEEIAKNTICLLYAEEQAGFLAGYAAVKDGYKNMGFFGGMELPPVIRYGYGFIQGAEYAAKELNMAKNSITLNYLYTGSFEASTANQAKAALWYHKGTKVIFACGGAVGKSVIAAAEIANAYVIGVDSDQSFDSSAVITSAMKMVKASVYKELDAYYEDEFVSGASQILNVSNDGIGLAIENSHFAKFTKDDYEKIYTTLKENKNNVTSDIVKDEKIKIKDIKTECVRVVIDNIK